MVFVDREEELWNKWNQDWSNSQNFWKLDRIRESNNSKFLKSMGSQRRRSVEALIFICSAISCLLSTSSGQVRDLKSRFLLETGIRLARIRFFNSCCYLSGIRFRVFRSTKPYDFSIFLNRLEQITEILMKSSIPIIFIRFVSLINTLCNLISLHTLP